jgi:glycosyltransferase involved in cell wall biosynthesis
MNSNLLALLSSLQGQNGTLPPELLKHVETHLQTSPVTAKKVLLVGTHIQQFTGYSKVMYNIVNFLAKKPNLNIVHYGFQRAKTTLAEYRPYPANVKSYDAADLEQPTEQGFGYKNLPDIIRKERPDVIMIYNDALVVCRFIEEIVKHLNADDRRRFKLIVYLDQVYKGQRPMFLDIIRREASVVFAFTEQWKKVLEKQFKGDSPKPRINVLRHGFSPDMFKPIDKTRVRGTLGIPANSFLMLNVNRNSPRKRYDILIKAFVELIVKYPTKPIFLLCICDKGEKGGYPLFEIYLEEMEKRSVNVGMFKDRLMVSNVDQSLPDSEINNLYNVADIGVTTTEGEGFGLCQLEQMGVGVPQVVPNIMGINEFCNANNSILVQPSVHYYVPVGMGALCGEASAVDSHDYCMGIETYMLDSTLREAHGLEAKKMANTFVWDTELQPLYDEIMA